MLNAPSGCRVGWRHILGRAVTPLIRPGRGSRVQRIQVFTDRACLGLTIIRPCLRRGSAAQPVVAARVDVHLAAVHRRLLTRHQARLGAAAHDLLEQGAEHIAVAEAVMPVLAESAVIGHRAVQAEAAEPRMGQVEVDVGAQFALGADASEITDQQHANHQLGIDRRASDGAVVRRHHAADERGVEQSVHSTQRMIGRDMVIQPKRVEQRLRHHPLAHHRRLHRIEEVSE